ncbi:hypothetical protein ETD83_28190 [Actinomadura soli]|uniref:Novel STAND NTPase 1 domain-containing protein n=1 Tax=Actinomadura soli TaxID=2508997 RepID=A0A5C4J5G6_9ACTN|nr:hypothetical protein [Actinomadura soli]TMQ92074.1 hypothetical protein ETD83_28190 [Actinomadura soli]
MPEPLPRDNEHVTGIRPDPRLIDSPEGFARALRVLRAQSGLSFRRMAAILNRGGPESVSASTLSGWFNGDHLPTSMLVGVVPRLIGVLGERDPAKVAEWQAALDRVRVRPGPRPAAAAPFRGLESYGPEHAEYFCGREALTADLLELAAQAYARGMPVMVIGASGSGKSSLLGAGLIPGLNRNGLNRNGLTRNGLTRDGLNRDGSRPLHGEWRHCTFTPGDRPVLALARRLSEWTGASPEVLEREILEDPRNCADRLAMARDPGRGHLLIVVDQFEELFTSVGDETQRQAFLAALFAAAEGPRRTAGSTPGSTEGRRSALVVLGMRADFYPQAVEMPCLVPVLQDTQLIVGSLSEPELREVLTVPAHRAGLSLSDGLVESLVWEMAPTSGTAPGHEPGHDRGALPLLSHALLATWMHAKGRTLTVEHYRATKGIQGAVAMTADATYADLTPAQQDIARHMFLRLVRTEEDSRDTRRRVAYEELLHDAAHPGNDPSREVLDRFIVARLITADHTTAEISHEVLITSWPLLREWLAADRDWLRVHRRLTADAKNWLDGGRDPDTLYRGVLLQTTREWVDERGYRGRLNALESRFLDAAITRQAEEQQRARRRTRRLRQLVAALSILLVLSGLLTGYAFEQRSAADRARTTASSRLTAARADRLREHDVSLSMQLALIAYRIAPTVEARSSLINSTAVPASTRLRPGAAQAKRVAVRADGEVLAAGTDLGSVQVWTVGADGRFKVAGLPLAGPGGPIEALDLSADGRVLAAAGRDRKIHVWNLTDSASPVRLGVLDAPGGQVMTMALSRDGATLAAAGEGPGVHLWPLAGSKSPIRPIELRGPTGAIRAVAITPDGRTLTAGGEDRAVWLWDIGRPARPKRLARLTGPASQIFSIAISRDGRTLAAGTGAQHNVHLWRISDPDRPVPIGAPLTGPVSWVNFVAFSPNGRFLAAGSADKLVWLFDLADRRPIGRLPHPSSVIDGVYRGEQSLVTLGEDGTVRAWTMPGPVINGPNDSVFGLSFDATGRRLGVAAGAIDNTVTMWDVATTQRPFQIGRTARNSQDAPPYSGAGTLTPNGRVFAVGDTVGGVQLWDFRDPARPVKFGPTVPVAGALIESLVSSDDGTLLAAGADDGKVHLIDIARPRRPEKTAELSGPTSLVFSCAISPGSRLLAAASADGNAYLWDLGDRHRPTRLATLGRTAKNEAYAVTFSPDGRTLAVGKANGDVQLWDVANPSAPTRLGNPMTGPASVVYSLAFNPDKPVLAVGDTDSSVWLWDLTRPHEPIHLATLTGPAMSILGVAFSPDGRTVAAGGHDHAVWLWNTDPAGAAAFVCATAGQPITRHEWAQYVPGRKYEPPCP